jgi:hypothetical protein
MSGRKRRKLIEWGKLIVSASDPRKLLSQKKATQIVRQAIRSGALKIENCVVCGKRRQIEAHHEDYSKPLEITWLCRPCHRAYHKDKAWEDEMSRLAEESRCARLSQVLK